LEAQAIARQGSRRRAAGRPVSRSLLAAGLLLWLTGCQVSIPPAPPATRDVAVTIQGLVFVPDYFKVRVGETIRFKVNNPTDVAHELYIGFMTDQLMHEAVVNGATGAPKVEAMQQSGYGIYLEPFDSGEFVYHFNSPGQIVIGCHVPGHWAAGMRATIDVRP
jgi:uncharacterized cupredoxin-like copper-binding protein